MNRLLFVLMIGFTACKDGKRPSPPTNCPSNTRPIVIDWGPNGWAQACAELHGPFRGWEGGKVVVEGRYEHGRFEDGRAVGGDAGPDGAAAAP